MQLMSPNITVGKEGNGNLPPWECRRLFTVMIILENIHRTRRVHTYMKSVNLPQMCRGLTYYTRLRQS